VYSQKQTKISKKEKKMKKKFFTPFAKKMMMIATLPTIAIIFISGYTALVHHEMNKFRADGGYWKVSATEKTADGLPALEWQPIR
jgi:hypothetical protein